jgi:hypothetical protein
MVSYYDATNRRLKFAVEDGGWKVAVLKELKGLGDVGRYSKMQIVDGKPVIAFLQIESNGAGKTKSSVVVARATTELPHEASDFAFTNVAVENDNPCSTAACPPGNACIKKEGLCVPTVSGCTPACGANEACVGRDNKGSCETVSSLVATYPDVFGDYISMAKTATGIGIVVYDRPRGNLIALVERGNSFERVIVDGETGSRPSKALDTGDVGIAASLQIDAAGTWHISYVSGLDESLHYITMTDGKPGASEVVDDGSSVDGKTFTDGIHVVGDDSAIRVNGDAVTIYYQDATAGTLRRAVGTRAGGAHQWALRAIPQPDRFAGYFPQIVPGEDRVANFWRRTDRSSKSAVGDVAILSP